MSERIEKVMRVAALIGRTPTDLGPGCEVPCDADGGVCICADIHRQQAEAVVHLLDERATSEICSTFVDKGGEETIRTLLDLLNPLHGEIDRQTYDERYKQDFDAPEDAEYTVDITARMERDLTQAVLILENRLRKGVF